MLPIYACLYDGMRLKPSRGKSTSNSSSSVKLGRWKSRKRVIEETSMCEGNRSKQVEGRLEEEAMKDVA